MADQSGSKKEMDATGTINAASSSSVHQIKMCEVPEQSSAKMAAEPKTRTSNFLVNSEMIQAVPSENQAPELRALGLSVFNQDQFEMGVMAQMDDAIARAEKERTRKVLQKDLKAVDDEMRKVDQEIEKVDRIISSFVARGRGDDVTLAIRKQKEDKLGVLKRLHAKEKSLKRKLAGNDEGDLDVDDALQQNGTDASMDTLLGLKDKKVPKESEREQMIRLGEMTPFGTVVKKAGIEASTSKLTDFELFLQGADDKYKSRKPAKVIAKKTKSSSSSPELPKSESSNLNSSVSVQAMEASHSSSKPDDTGVRKRRKTMPLDASPLSEGEITPMDDSEEEYKPGKDKLQSSSESEFEAEKAEPDCRRWADETSDEEMLELKMKTIYKRKGKTPKKKITRRHKDDGSASAFKKRLSAHEKKQKEENDGSESSVEVDDDFRCPSSIWNNLYRYQKTGVRWLWELHGQQTGGIVGDEMGLGKTIQIIAFLAALKRSRCRDPGFRYLGLGPVIVVCPTTVMHQWVKEFHKWWPPFRVAVLHSTGTYRGSDRNLVYTTYHDNGVLVMSYGSVLIHQEILLEYDWHYVILDEGHKIRNPDAQITIACKQFRTSHRIILSGSPMQNNLKELWSLFDFVFPGKLGTLPDFMEHFSVPITQGGYSNASEIQVQTAYKCACVLRDTISPYLLRRMKADVASNLKLPEKNEQVLFCHLTDRQRDVYKEYLNSKECHLILSGRYMVFPGLITLRKICNHPDLAAASERQLGVLYQDSDSEQLDYGYPSRSGKLVVVQSLLKLWYEQKHRVLLFTQGRQMLDILEKLVDREGYQYMRMDGSTAIGSRQMMVDRFNEDDSIFVFVLTTKVGGLGVNLIGADRVVIFDPDWNPSTDTQARERAWRIGQTKQVTIYRLLTSGTIEEKIYHRQIFKQFLTNRVLKDPKQRRFFKSNDLHELFTLADDNSNSRHGTETSALFAGTGSDVRVKVKDEEVKSVRMESLNKSNRFDKMRELNKDVSDDDDEDHTVVKKERADRDNSNGSVRVKVEELDPEDEKTRKMKELARKLSQQISQGKSATLPDNGSKTHSSTRSSHSSSKHKHSHSTHGKHKDEHSHSSHHKHKSKKHKKHVEIDGAVIPNLAKKTAYTTGKEEDTTTKKKKKNQDDFVLQSLFEKSGVHSAVQHDRIMDSGDADYLLVEQEANKVAKEAAQALKQSRSRCRAGLGVPTWTGQSGLAGAPGTKPTPRFGKKKTLSNVSSMSKDESSNDSQSSNRLFDGAASGFNANDEKRAGKSLLRSQSTGGSVDSSSILERILKRTDTRLGGESGSAMDSNSVLLDEIRTFVAFKAKEDGQASTQEILDAFTEKLPPSESAKFKAMLKEICRFEKRGDLGVWILKEEFR